MKKILVINDRLDAVSKEKISECAKQYGYTCEFYDNEEQALPSAEDAEIIYGQSMKALEVSKSLKWIHLPWAGAAPFLKKGVVPDSILLSNSAGAYGVAVSEHMVMMTLMLLRDEVYFQDEMKKRHWVRPVPQSTGKDSRVLVLGAGDIGRCYARRIRAFEPASIIGISRSGRTQDPAFDGVYPESEADRFLPRADIVAMILPDTPQTENFMNAQRIASLPAHARIVNAGRGNSIDEEALVRALNSGALGGAALDVFRKEPLPEDSPLWSAKNILLTPHIGGNLTAPYTIHKNVDMFLEDFVNYCEGRPMKYLLDRVHGY